LYRRRRQRSRSRAWASRGRACTVQRPP